MTALFVKDESLMARHGFFTRGGGVSTGIYDSLNCAFGTDDDRASIEENRRRAVTSIGGDIKNLVTLYQDHTPDCLYIGAPTNDRPRADAMVTDASGVVLGILTADCAPVLFDGGHVIGAAHAGWKGAIGGVLENTVKMMRGNGAKTIRAVIGPCIGPQSYEVSPGFEKPFLAQDAGNEVFFRNGRFDLPGYAAHRLRLIGADVTITGQDTYAAETDFFSYRRKTKRQESDYGRQISLIMMGKGDKGS